MGTDCRQPPCSLVAPSSFFLPLGITIQSWIDKYIIYNNITVGCRIPPWSSGDRTDWAKASTQAIPLQGQTPAHSFPPYCSQSCQWWPVTARQPCLAQSFFAQSLVNSRASLVRACNVHEGLSPFFFSKLRGYFVSSHTAWLPGPASKGAASTGPALGFLNCKFMSL